MEFVFGYGSLAGRANRGLQRDADSDGFVADLDGYRRTWGVAMDNAVDLPGYKYFVNARTGERPPVYVAFLDIARVDAGSINGVCLPVSSSGLEALDRRERNYCRVEVTERVRGPLPATVGRVWVYEGSVSGRTRRSAGDRLGRTVIQRAYLEMVWSAFAALGEAEIAAFCTSTIVPDCDIAALDGRPLADDH
jgi:hypothetical protein